MMDDLPTNNDHSCLCSPDVCGLSVSMTCLLPIMKFNFKQANSMISKDDNCVVPYSQKQNHSKA